MAFRGRASDGPKVRHGDLKLTEKSHKRSFYTTILQQSPNPFRRPKGTLLLSPTYFSAFLCLRTCEHVYMNGFAALTYSRTALSWPQTGPKLVDMPNLRLVECASGDASLETRAGAVDGQHGGDEDGRADPA